MNFCEAGMLHVAAQATFGLCCSLFSFHIFTWRKRLLFPLPFWSHFTTRHFKRRMGHVTRNFLL